MPLTTISSNAYSERSLISAPVASLSAQVSAMTSAAAVTAISRKDVQPTITDKVILQKNMEEEKNRIQKTARGVGEIVFAYNFRGDLRVQFTDTQKNLVYQTPPQLFARITDIMSYPKTAVDTRV